MIAEGDEVLPKLNPKLGARRIDGEPQLSREVEDIDPAGVDAELFSTGEGRADGQSIADQGDVAAKAVGARARLRIADARDQRRGILRQVEDIRGATRRLAVSSDGQ